MPPTKLAAVALALALTVGCSGGDDDDTSADDTEASSNQLIKPNVELTVTRADLVSPHRALGPLDDPTRTTALAVVQDLLRIASAEPLSNGEAGRGFAELFTPDAAARAATEDRAAFFDEDLPRFGELEQREATVELVGLAGGMDPATKLVVARFAWEVESSLRPGDRVRRTGDVSLIPDGKAWRIAAYSLNVARTIDDETTTTTAESDS